jgi:CRISPR/Cas system CSM-associated protein Csm4 (group 5 of RAMP superfamily)
MALFEVKLRPTGPWRVGHPAGDRHRTGVVYRSDALYSALTHAMRSLGWLEDWLGATARAASGSAVRFSSLFPFVGRTRLVAPPRSLWPPQGATRLFLEAAKLVPLDVLRTGVIEESRWMVDGESGCMLPTGGSAPFQIAVRASAAVDRITGAVEPHRIACLEFAPNGGFWGLVDTSAEWEPRVKSAFRLLADSGFGGERSRGWGRALEPQFSDAANIIPPAADSTRLWLLSAFSPSETDTIDWTSSDYTAEIRNGWTDSLAGAALKRSVRQIAEGAVIAAPVLQGRAVDVAPDGFAHPVYRAGFAFALPLPAELTVRAEPLRPVVAAQGPEAVPAPESEAAPEQEVQPEPAAEPAVEAAAETGAEALVTPEPQPEREPTSEPQVQSEVGVEPVSAPEPETVPEPAPVPEIQPEPEPAPEVTPEPEPQPDVQPEPQPSETEASEAPAEPKPEEPAQ